MRLIPIIVILVLVSFFITIGPNIFGGFETQHNMTAYSSGLGSNYTPEYEALTDITQTDMVLIGVIGTLLVIAMVFILVKIFL